MTVVSDAYAVARLQRAFPAARIRHAPLGVRSGPRLAEGSEEGSEQGSAEGQAQGRPIVGALATSRLGVIQRAFDRARDAGARLELITGPPEHIIDTADVVIAMTWPPADESTMVLAAMAGARVVIVSETESTAGWPALDPQTWQPRGWNGAPPIVVSVDPRDEEHSLSLALRRLATDAALRQSLGSAAHTWWQRHATLDRAVNEWRSILDEAVTLSPPPRPGNWPPHLTADGTERARELLSEFGATVDFLS